MMIPKEFCIAWGPFSLLRVGCIWSLEIGSWQLAIIGKILRAGPKA